MMANPVRPALSEPEKRTGRRGRRTDEAKERTFHQGQGRCVSHT